MTKHVQESGARGLSTVLLRMDNAGNLGEMQKITLEGNIFTLSTLTLRIQDKEDPRKSETEEITSTNPCSQVTKSKLKAFLQNKGSQGIVLRTMPGQYASRTEPDVITISEDDGNTSLTKSLDIHPSTSTDDYSRKRYQELQMEDQKEKHKMERVLCL